MPRTRNFILVLVIVGALGIASVGGATAHSTMQAGRATSTGRVWARITAGGDHTCGMRRDHTLWCWGDNSSGELGLGDTTNRLIPTEVGSDTDWVSVSAGSADTCGTRLDHTLWCWGDNQLGQLGLGDAGPGTGQHSPVQVGSDTDWTTVSAGFLGECAIRLDHSLWCWGGNDDGELGLGDMEPRFVPTQVGRHTDWARVKAGLLDTCAIRLDHTLWCWGLNASGQLGLGDTTNRLIPSQVGSDTDWVRVTAGGVFTCGIRLDETLWCWGNNVVGELGLGYVSNAVLTPTQVGADSDWARVAAGGTHACASRLDHALWCWGSNRFGELGLGDRTDRHTPAQVGSATDWAAAQSWGGNSTCGIRLFHTLWCWGQNGYGQLGLGVTGLRLVPKRV